jgi:glyoxylase-like metal-dependent hydrolase (beta-lactamase superfamily II)
MDDWSIWMLEYARCDVQPVPRVLYGEGYGKTAYFPFSFLLLVGKGHTALVDVGYDPEREFISKLLHENAITCSRDAPSVLSKVGIRPEAVDTIFVTHAHYDHMGNLPAFPNARVYLQTREIERWEYALGMPSRFSALRESVDPADILYVRQLQEDGRLVLVDGVAQDVLPGIDLRPAFDSHTDGSQYVVIRNAEHTWVATGDNMFSYANAETTPSHPSYRGIGYGTGSLWRSLLIIDEMLTIAGAVERLAIVHEGETFQRFPSVRTADSLAVSELCLARGAESRLPVTS